MRVYLSDKELAEITVKQGKDAHMFEYYIGSIKIGVLDERVMQNNILMLDAVKDKYVAEEIEKAIDSMPRENILQEIQEDKDIEDYINEKYGEIEKVQNVRKIDLDKEIENEKKVKKSEKDKKTKTKPAIKQSVKLDERANDVSSMRRWLGGNIPAEFDRIGVVESSDMKEYGGKNTTRYSLVLMDKDGNIEPAEKYLPQLKQRTTRGNNPTKESYQVRTDGKVEQDAVLSEYQMGDKIIQLDNKQYGRISLEIGKEARNSTETVSQEVRGENTLFATSKTQRSVIGEYKEKGEDTVEENIKEADAHKKENPECEELRTEDIDGDATTQSHTHNEIILEDGSKISFERLAVRWGLFDDNGQPDIENAKTKYLEKCEENVDASPEQIIDELDGELDDPRAVETRRR